MSLLQIDWHPNKKTLCRFGIGMLIAFAVLGTLLHFGLWPVRQVNPTAGTACWVFGIVTGLLGISGTRAALPVYWFWMAISAALGAVIGPLVSAAIYYLVVTPIGLLGRAIGRDALRLRRGGETYWVDVKTPEDARRYKRQF